VTARYHDASAFRASLDDRINNTNRQTGTPHDRLRKNVAFHRLVARFIAAEDDRWALKGGVALLWRVAADVRTTRDVDANWAGTNEDLEAFLDEVVARDLGDWFGFAIGPPRALSGETEGGFRFAVTARLAGREFTAFHLDINLVSDERPVERVPIHLAMLAFAELADLEVPMITVAHQVAEKLHAVARSYSGGPSSRAKDAYDSMLYAQASQLPSAGEIREAVVDTFAIRDTPVPTTAPPLPSSWHLELELLLSDYPIPGVDGVSELERAWQRLWGPVLDNSVPDAARWDAATMSWATPAR
jgi:Nucleotidyl transferase AbiEii toxin, Type IV TA system